MDEEMDEEVKEEIRKMNEGFQGGVGSARRGEGNEQRISRGSVPGPRIHDVAGAAPTPRNPPLTTRIFRSFFG